MLVIYSDTVNGADICLATCKENSSIPTDHLHWTIRVKHLGWEEEIEGQVYVEFGDTIAVIIEHVFSLYAMASKDIRDNGINGKSFTLQ